MSSLSYQDFVYDLHSIDPQYLWLVIVGGILCWCAAWGIGANDTANSWGSTVGAKAISVRNAAICAGIFEVVGAFALGANVGGTLKNKILPPSYYCYDNYSLVTRMIGMLCVDLGSATWLFIASQFGMPVSTTHAAVGGIVGFGIVTRGWGAIVWWEEMFKIFMSWLSSPLLSAFIGFVMQWTIKRLLFSGEPGSIYRKNHLYLPAITGLFIGVAAVFAFYIGGKSNSAVKELPAWMFAVTFVSVSIGMIIILTLAAWWARKHWDIDLDMYKTEKLNAIESSGSSDDEEAGIELQNPAPTPAGPFSPPVSMPPGRATPAGPFSPPTSMPPVHPTMAGPFSPPVSMPPVCATPAGPFSPPVSMPPASPTPVYLDNFDLTAVHFQPDEEAPVKACEGAESENESAETEQPEETKGSKKKATFFSGKMLGEDRDIYAGMTEEMIAAEQLWKPLCWIVACVESFSHGANDVGNAIGPYAALIDSYNAKCPKGSSEIPYWILGLGASGILLGLMTYGHRVIKTLGVDIAVITPQRAAAAEISTVLTVLFATSLGIPVSTTHCTVGAITGMSLVTGYRDINWKTISGVAACIIITVPACALMTAAIFGFWQAAVFGPMYPGAWAFQMYANETVTPIGSS